MTIGKDVLDRLLAMHGPNEVFTMHDPDEVFAALAVEADPKPVMDFGEG